MKKPLALSAVAAMLAFGISSAQQPVRIGMAFDAGGKNDRSFNQSAFEGATRAAKKWGVQVKDFEPSDPSQVGQGIRSFAEAGFDLIIGVGFANEPSITKTAAEFKDTKFAVIDSVPTGDNTAGAVFREHEGSFLVGYIAGKTSSTGVIGFVGGMQIPLIKKFYVGFNAGVKAACPTCRTIENYTGTTPEAWNNPAKAKEIATAQGAQGADIIYAAAGASYAGALQYVTQTKCVNGARPPRGLKLKAANKAIMSMAKPADYKAKCKGANDRPMFFIGVDSNQNYLGDTDKNPKTMNYVLTSMLKRVDLAVYNMIGSVAQNRPWTKGAIEFGLDNSGVGYAIDQYNEALIGADVIKGVEAAKARIVNGNLDVPEK
jgi:basic membrane protein A and related proteins